MADIILTLLLCLWLASATVGLIGSAFFAHQSRHFARLARAFPQPDPPPAVAVILPIKGTPPSAAACIKRILAQGHPRLRLIVAVEAADDPAHRLAAEAVARDPRVSLVVAGRTVRRGQKVHNLIAALATLAPADDIICFADADALWPNDTVSELCREFFAWDEPVLLSGYRWMFPARSSPGAVLAAAASLPVAAAAKAPAWDLAWGGTMATTRATLGCVDLPALWDRSLSDDAPLSEAMRRRACVKLMPNLFVPSPAEFSLGAALNFARRQYAMLRLYAPRHWLFSFGVHAVFFAGFGASLAAFAIPSSTLAVALALAAWGVALARGLVHAAVVWRWLPPPVRARMGVVCALDALAPVAPALLHAYGLLTTLRPRRVRWAGITYTLEGRDVDRVEHGSEPSRLAWQMRRKKL